MDVHVPGDADVGAEGVFDYVIDRGGAAVGHESVKTEIGADLGVVFHAEAVGEVGLACFAEDVVETGRDAVADAESGKGLVGFVLLVGTFHEDVEFLVEIDVGAADHGEIVAPVFETVGVVDEVEIDVPMLILQFVANGDVVHEIVVGTFEHVDRMEQFEVSHFSAIEEVEREEAALPFLAEAIAQIGTIVHIGRVGHLHKEHVLGIVGLVGGSHSGLEAIEVVPVVGAEKDVDGRGVVFETTHGQSVFTKTDHPVLGGGVVYVEEVGIVEKANVTWTGNDALTEEIAEFLVQGAANNEVEVTTVETVGRLDSVALASGVAVVVEIGTGLQFNLGENGGEVHLGGHL